MSRGEHITRSVACGLSALAVAVVVGCGGGDEETTSSTTSSTTKESDTSSEAKLDDFGFPVNAHVQPQLGTVPEGIELDAREGTPPAEVKEPDLEAAAVAASCDLQLGLPDEGNTHIADEDAADVDYGTNPPTSGDHYANPSETVSGALADGAYLEYPPVGRFVHAMEHQRVLIQYSPDLSEEDQLALKGVFDADPAGVILFPNPDMPYEVAVTGWTNLMGCDSFDGDATLDAVQDFRDEFRGNRDVAGTESIPLEL